MKVNELFESYRQRAGYATYVVTIGLYDEDSNDAADAVYDVHTESEADEPEVGYYGNVEINEVTMEPFEFMGATHTEITPELVKYVEGIGKSPEEIDRMTDAQKMNLFDNFWDARFEDEVAKMD